jgi:hypothetical protein
MRAQLGKLAALLILLGGVLDGDEQISLVVEG